MGTDFAFQYANITYEYIEGIARIVNNHKDGAKFKFVYSTAQEYVDAVRNDQEEMDIEWPTYTGDFFPLTGNFPGHTWSGYFSSRPNFKKLIREFSAVS